MELKIRVFLKFVPGQDSWVLQSYLIFLLIFQLLVNPLYLGLYFILKGLAIYPKFSLPVIIITTLKLRQKTHWAQILSYMHQHVL